MPFTPPPPRPRPEGQYTSMTDMVKLGAPLEVTEVIDDDENSYKGDKKPRFLVKGKPVGGDTEVLVSVSKGYSRDDFLIALQEHLENSEDESVAIRFVRTAGSAYIDIQTA